MPKIPKNPAEIFEEFTKDYISVFGDDLLTIILYGSGAKGEYQYKKSDINFLIVLTEQGINNLRKCLALIPKWNKRNVSTPLFLTIDYIESALDSFPIEFLGMNMSYEVIYGEDILKDIPIEEDDLRLALERELRGKLLHLREGFLNAASNSRHLKILISQSLAAFTTIFSALLRLKDVHLPQKRRDILLQTAETFGLDQSLFETLLDIRENKKKMNKDELLVLMEKYINAIGKLTQIIDKL